MKKYVKIWRGFSILFGALMIASIINAIYALFAGEIFVALASVGLFILNSILLYDCVKSKKDTITIICERREK